MVVHAETGVVVHKTRHGKHRDTEERRAYRREWMRKKRKGV
jgi:hypothetical protein